MWRQYCVERKTVKRYWERPWLNGTRQNGTADKFRVEHRGHVLIKFNEHMSVYLKRLFDRKLISRSVNFWTRICIIDTMIILNNSRGITHLFIMCIVGSIVFFFYKSGIPRLKTIPKIWILWGFARCILGVFKTIFPITLCYLTAWFH